MKAERTSNRAATADDVIRLAGEHLTQEGCVGFSDTWRPDQFSSFFSLSAAEPKDVARLVIRDLDLMSALGTAICDHTRSEWLKMMLREHAALTQDLSAHLDVKLRQKGYTKVECEQQGLRRKLIAFLEAHLPNAIEIPKFKVYLLTPAGGVGPKKEKTDLFFPWNCSFTDFLGTLCDCTAQSARLAGHNGGYTLRDGSWKYRLVCGGKMDVDCEPQSICNEGHLRGMIKKLTCNTTHASVWHSTSTFDQAGMNGSMDDDYSEELQGLLDWIGDGEDLLEPVNWNLLAKTGVGGSNLLARPVDE